MITANDTKVFVEINEPDSVYSEVRVSRCLGSGTVLARDVVCAEVASVHGGRQSQLLTALVLQGNSELLRLNAIISPKVSNGKQNTS